MPDTLTSISHLINSPPGQLAAGGVWQAIAVQFGFGLGLFYGVTKVFDLVGDRLNEDTKLEIAVWLLGVKVSQKLEPWPDTFARVFDRVFGKKHLSWKCFWRSCVASSIMTLFGLLLFLGLYRQDESSFPATFGGISLDWSFRWWINEVLVFLPLAVVANAFPDYLSLLKTRYLLGSIHGGPWRGLVSVAIDLMVTGVLSLSSAGILGLLYPVTTDYVLATICRSSHPAKAAGTWTAHRYYGLFRRPLEEPRSAARCRHIGSATPTLHMRWIVGPGFIWCAPLSPIQALRSPGGTFTPSQRKALPSFWPYKGRIVRRSIRFPAANPNIQ